MPEPPFAGIGVALATLFDSDGELDTAATADHAARLVNLGVEAVVVAGSTGEAAALSAEERSALLVAVREAVPDPVPVLAGTGAASARQAAALTLSAREHGADAVLVLSPPGVVDPRPYYEVVAAAAADTPVLAYHFPSLSAPGIAVERLADLPVAGLKDSSGDPDRLLAELEWALGAGAGAGGGAEAGVGLALYTGAAALLALAGPLGCAGAILSLANAEPELCIAAFAGDAGAQRRLGRAQRRARSAPAGGGPVGIKSLMAERFGTSIICRL